MKLLGVLLSLLLIITVLALYLSPELWWGLALVGVFAPILLMLNFLLLLYWAWKPSWWSIGTVVAIVFALGIIDDTVSLSTTESPDKACVQVLSYNVSHFGKPKGYNFVGDSTKLPNMRHTKDFVKWVVEHPAPIKCFQEFYTFSENPLFDTDAALKQAGWTHSYLSADTLRVNKSRFGAGIYSKYPMLQAGTIFIATTRFNRGIWADVVTGEDTLRIVNVHFQSAQLQRARNKSGGGLNALRKLLWVYKASLQERNEQLRHVLSFVQESPYPVILSGDMNSTPYSHVYQLLDTDLMNAFEEEGNGFGFTFNHPKLFFLRIDHQFISEQLETCAFTTRQDVPYSAHYPLEGWFKLK